MTEEEWLRPCDPNLLLPFLTERGSARKLRLLDCALCRCRWHSTQGRGRCAVEVAERFADGQAVATRLAEAWQDASAALAEANTAFECAAWTREHHTAEEAAEYAAYAAAAARPDVRHGHPGVRGAEQVLMLGLIRDLFGNPFRPVSLPAGGLTPAVLSLAQAAYEQRSLPSGELDPARLAVLADALEEAGCTDDAILSHLRCPGPHVRGCWPVDLCLGKG